MRRIFWKLFILCLPLLSLSSIPLTTAQLDILVRLSTPDLSAFPQISFTIQTTDQAGMPLTDFSTLSIEENGVPVRDFSQQSEPVGIDVIFVIDSSDAIFVEDSPNGRSRFAELQDSVRRYANRFMNPSGLDSVSIIVPDEANPERSSRILLHAATTSRDVITAIDGYLPTPTNTTPLNRMMVSALTQTRGLQTGSRFQAILVFSATGDRWQQQINTTQLVAQANAQQVAIFTAVLGAGATVEELDNVSRLVTPTRGFLQRMPAAEEIDPVYLLWQRQANQLEITYQSQLIKSGHFPLVVSIGGGRAETAVSLQIASPHVELTVDTDAIRRQATGVEVPLAAFMPTTQPVTVTVQWPDGIDRTVTSVSLLVNDVSQFLTEPPVIDNNIVSLIWDIRNNNTGAYELTAQVTDSFGLVGESKPQLITIITEQMPLPTPTPLPATAVPTQAAPLFSIPAIPRENALFAMAAGALGLITVIFLRWLRRNRDIFSPPQPAARPQSAVSTPEPPLPAKPPPQAALLPLSAGDPISIKPAQLIIGQDADTVDLHLDGKAVAARHAQIRYRNGRYWLTDEGSQSGTFLNHTRLGLGPQPLQDGDLIQIGRFSFQFLIHDEDSA